MQSEVGRGTSVMVRFPINEGEPEGSRKVSSSSSSTTTPPDRGPLRRNRFMKKMTALIAALLALAIPVVSFAAMNHENHQGDVVHQEVVDGVMATFKVLSMKDHMKAMKMEMPKDSKETHHIAVEFKDVRTGKALTEGMVRVTIQKPDKRGENQAKDLIGMQGHFGGGFDLSWKGKYGVMIKFKLKDEKVRRSKFWYNVK